MNIPDGLLYTNDHEWIKVENGTGIIGITDYAQNELKDIVFLNIDTDTKELNKGQTFGAIEAVKTVSDLFSPVTGNVIEFNKDVLEKAELLNQDPYGSGWIVKCKITNPDDLKDLMDANAYKTFLGL